MHNTATVCPLYAVCSTQVVTMCLPQHMLRRTTLKCKVLVEDLSPSIPHCIHVVGPHKGMNGSSTTKRRNHVQHGSMALENTQKNAPLKSCLLNCYMVRPFLPPSSSPQAAATAGQLLSRANNAHVTRVVER